MNWKRPISALLLVMCILCALPRTARAHEVPDDSKKGTVKVEMKYDGKPVKGGTLTLYRVGDVHEDDGNYSFVKTDKMAAFSGDYADLSDPDLAKEVADYVQDHKISSVSSVYNTTGTVTFRNLNLGLYLIVQTKASIGFEPINPFLVSVPYNQDGHYEYDITAQVKTELYKEPTPTRPPDSDLPQSGQINWPVPVLAVLGLGLILLGLALRSGKKEPSDEA